jgi:hypothetical protein
MPRLELVFNCLHMFVADPEKNVVHVLMPSSDAHGSHHRHEARIFHAGLEGREKGHGLSMNGWALVLGKKGDSDTGTADTTLQPPFPPPLGDVLVNLSEITGGRVSRELVQDGYRPQVASRVSLYGGRVTAVVAEANYRIKDRVYALGHQVTWQMLDVPQKLEWVDLKQTRGGDPPIHSLMDLPADPRLGYRLEIHHVSHASLPRGQGGKLSPTEMASHYSMFFPLVGIEPADDLLPAIIDDGRTEGVNCGGGSAQIV